MKPFPTLLKDRLNWKTFSVFLLLLFGALMFYIPITNHYMFRTNTFDYGVYNYALYDYAYFRITPNPVYLKENVTFLQDHLSYTLFFLTPFYWLLKWIFGTYTLLIIQSSFIIWGGWASYKIVSEKTESSFLGFLTLVLYFTLYGRYSAFAADCNLMIILSSFVPVFLLYFHRGKTWITVACFLFLILGRESVPLWTFFISIFLIILYRKDRKKQKLAGLLAIASVVYFVFAFKVLIPYVQNNDQPFGLFMYSLLGDTPFEALKFMFSHPIDTFKLLFTNQSGESIFESVKGEFYFVYLLSGGILLFLRPYFLIPLIPIIAQKMWNDSPIRWGIGSYYDIEVAAILPILVVLLLAEMKWKKIALFLGCVACIMSISITLHKFDPDNRELNWIGWCKMNPLEEDFSYSYIKNFEEIHNELDKIPPNASVAATGNILPHMAFRDHIYYLPRLPKKVDYIVVLRAQILYVMTREQLDSMIENWRNDPELNIEFEDDNLLIFKRKKMT